MNTLYNIILFKVKVPWLKFEANVTPSGGKRDGYISQHVSYRYACQEFNISWQCLCDRL